MWKWLRSWFVWRFSLRRLVVAVLFLGAFVGLNMRTIGPRNEFYVVSGTQMVVVYFWGWPLPFMQKLDEWNLEREWSRYLSENDLVQGSPEEEQKKTAYTARWMERAEAALHHRFSLTHRTYALVDLPLLSWLHNAWATYHWDNGPNRGSHITVPYAILNVMVAIIPLFLLLFLHIPRRKMPEQVK